MLLGMYPKDHRAWFAAEMQSVFEESAQEHRKRGGARYLRFLLAECAGLVGGLGGAWAAKLTRGAYTHHPQLVRPSPATALPQEVQEAQDRVTIHLNSLLHAISHHDFVKARTCAAEEQKAREDLRLLRARYGIAE